MMNTFHGTMTVPLGDDDDTTVDLVVEFTMDESGTLIVTLTKELKSLTPNPLYSRQLNVVKRDQITGCFTFKVWLGISASPKRKRNSGVNILTMSECVR